ncbi:hypothetical protein ACWEJ6_51460 [Nonomuraea sp. NPDC004702]
MGLSAGIDIPADKSPATDRAEGNVHARVGEVLDMGTEAFYATAAQVLPTLLIALVIEVGMMLQSRMRIIRDLKASEGDTGRLWDWHWNSVDRWLWMGMGLAATFFIGEVLALLALGFQWFSPWTFFGIGGSMLVMCLAAVGIPIFRMLESFSQHAV